MIQKLIRMLDALMGDKIPEVTAAIDDVHEEQPTFPHSTVIHQGRLIPVKYCKCPKCESAWFCFGYSQEFIPVFCAYCGMKFTPLTEAGIARWGFVHRKRKGT